MPGEDGGGFDDGGDFRQSLFTELLADRSQGLALGVGELHASVNLVAQDTVLCDHIFVSQQELLFHRSGDIGQQSLPIHASVPFRHGP
jgi:hypothetical protein